MVEEARLFGMLNLATADTLINCWSDKENFGFWRPITAIREGDNDGNRFTVGDPNWTPLQANTAVSGPHFGVQLRDRGDDAHREGLLRPTSMSFDVVRIVPTCPT